MDWNQIAGNWKQLQGSVKDRWGQLTDDDLTRIDGQRDKLVGRIQEVYGVSKDEAEHQVEDFRNKMH